MSRTFRQMIPDEEGWSDWVGPRPGYLMQCCGCELVHELQVAIVHSHEELVPKNEGEDAEHVIVFRMRNASGTLTEGGDAKQAPGDSLSGPTLEEGDAQ